MTDARYITQELEPLPMRRRQLLQKDNNNCYRVISITGEQKDIEANTAYEAFRLAGMKQAVKIERLSNVMPIIIDHKQLAEAVSANEPPDSLANMEAEPLEPIRTFRNPVISADDLDKIMRGFRSDEKPIVVSEATGMEVHNDGFDEIIPTTPPEKLPVKEAQKAEAKNELPPAAAEEPASPEKALSQDEVEKLLKG